MEKRLKPRPGTTETFTEANRDSCACSRQHQGLRNSRAARPSSGDNGARGEGNSSHSQMAVAIPRRLKEQAKMMENIPGSYTLKKWEPGTLSGLWLYDAWSNDMSKEMVKNEGFEWLFRRQKRYHCCPNYAIYFYKHVGRCRCNHNVINLILRFLHRLWLFYQIFQDLPQADKALVVKKHLQRGSASKKSAKPPGWKSPTSPRNFTKNCDFSSFLCSAALPPWFAAPFFGCWGVYNLTTCKFIGCAGFWMVTFDEFCRMSSFFLHPGYPWDVCARYDSFRAAVGRRTQCNKRCARKRRKRRRRVTKKLRLVDRGLGEQQLGFNLI